MTKERTPRLLVDWDDTFSVLQRDEGGAAAAPAGSGWEPRLLVEWGQPLVHRHRVEPAPPELLIPYEFDFHLAVEWENELETSHRREAFLAAASAYLLVFVAFLIWPHWAPDWVQPAERTEESMRPLAALILPQDLLKAPAPQTPPDLTPEERRRATIRSPLTIDPRELEQLLPPAPPPSPGARSELAPSGPDRSERAAPSDPQRPREQARLEDLPRSGATSRGASPLELERASPGRAIEESLRRAQAGGGSGVGGAGEAGPIQPNLNTPFPLILSDTRGVDFGPYLVRLLHEVKRNWYAVIPESVKWGEKGRVVIVFSINKDGSVPLGQPEVVSSSGRSHLDRPAVASIRASQPFPPLPAEFTGDNIVLQFTFLYNLPIDYTGQ